MVQQKAASSRTDCARGAAGEKKACAGDGAHLLGGDHVGDHGLYDDVAHEIEVQGGGVGGAGGERAGLGAAHGEGAGLGGGGGAGPEVGGAV